MEKEDAMQLFRKELKKSKEKGRVGRSAEGDENVLPKEEHD
jgi:hypothetical protein